MHVLTYGLVSVNPTPLFSNCLQVRSGLVPLIKELKEGGTAPDRSFLQGEWDVDAQASLCKDVAMDLGGRPLQSCHVASCYST